MENTKHKEDVLEERNQGQMTRITKVIKLTTAFKARISVVINSCIFNGHGPNIKIKYAIID